MKGASKAANNAICLRVARDVARHAQSGQNSYCKSKPKLGSEP